MFTPACTNMAAHTNTCTALHHLEQNSWLVFSCESLLSLMTLFEIVKKKHFVFSFFIFTPWSPFRGDDLSSLFLCSFVSLFQLLLPCLNKIVWWAWSGEIRVSETGENNCVSDCLKVQNLGQQTSALPL